ncbi:sodium-coupled monocarboxylate transporter 1-like [Onthophagus taurus]|uniref:sodium-coupled monocarboxylate transporter 1-like n=1 Tax=Onthophagus taurus TaxID=166361 RepID=UPI0039BDC1F1
MNENSSISQTFEHILGVKFTWYDNSFFLLMLIISAFIGIYYGFYKKQTTAKDYLLGGKSMTVFPTALSLTANNVSGIALLAIPPDVYSHGIAYWITYVSASVVVFTSYWIFVPVFYSLGKNSTFEYLKLRFDTKTRLLGSGLFLISRLLYLPIVIYIPALALAQATGLNIHLITILVCVVCIFYTSVGGLKAVVYSDALQSTVMIGTLIIAFTLGVIRCGGLGNVWTVSLENDRLNLSSDLDLTKRDSIWAVTIGAFVAWTAFTGINQIYIQKCLALPTKSDVIKVLCIFSFGLILIGSLTNFMGLVMFTEYENCDPVEAGILNKPDQLLPYYIMDLSKQLPGLAGLFVAGIFSAALSTLSASLNSLSCTIYEDFLSKYIPKHTSQQKISTILKIIVVITGVICTTLVLVVEKLGGLLALTNSMEGVTSGSILGLFVAGMLIPKINAKGAFYGCIASMSIMAFVVFGSQFYQNSGYLIDLPLPVSTEGCPSNLKNVTKFDDVLRTSHADIPYIFRIQFYWYGLMGLILCIMFALIISIFTRNYNKEVPRELLSPVILPFISKKREIEMKNHGVYKSLDQTLEFLENERN